MANENKHIDNFLKDSLENFQGVTTQSDWAIIESKLNQRRKRRAFFWISVAFVIFSIGGLSLYLNYVKSSTENAVELVIDSKTKEDDKVNFENLENTNLKVDQDNLSIKKETKFENQSIRRSANVDKSRENNRITKNNISINDKEPKLDPLAKEDVFKSKELTKEKIKDIDKPVKTKSTNTSDEKKFEIDLKKDVVDTKSDAKDSKDNVNNNSGTTNGFSRWEIGMSLTPSIAGKWVNLDKQLGGLVHKEYGNITNNSERNLAAYTASFNANYDLGRNFYLAMGINFSKRGESVNYDYVVDSFPFVDETRNVITDYGPIPASLKERYQYSGSNSYHFIEVPLGIGYKLPIYDKFMFRNEVGLSYWRMISREGQKPNYTELNLENLKEISTYNLNNVAAYVSTGLFVDYPKITIGLEPNFTWTLNSIQNSNSAIREKSYNYGLNLTLNYKLSK